MASRLNHLQQLEAESIYVLREAASECEKPAMLYSTGKDSSVLLHLAQKAFYPAKPPFPLLYIDTSLDRGETVELRDRAASLGLDVLVYPAPQEPIWDIGTCDHGTSPGADVMESQALKSALDQYRFTAALSGIRREEYESQAPESIFSVQASGQHGPRSQRTQLWDIYNTSLSDGCSLHVFPLLNWNELDIWRYIEHERIAVAPLYFAQRRPVTRRRDSLVVVTEGMRLPAGQAPEMRLVRFRALGCYRGGTAIESSASTVAEIISETVSELDEPGQEEGCLESKNHAVTARTGPLRVVVCGGAETGKSALIERLLCGPKRLFEDSTAAGEQALGAPGKQRARLGPVLYDNGGRTDGREQRNTFDVAYRFFATARRQYIVADTPGLEQYTRGVASGASTAQLAVIVIDARQGIVTQTKLHSRIIHMLGIRHLIVAVNKMDLVEWDASVYARIELEYHEFARELPFQRIQIIPISALNGDNLLSQSTNSSWYRGKTLVQLLEDTDISEQEAPAFRMPVQWVAARNETYRGFGGRVAAGQARPGDRVRVIPSGVEASVASVVTFDGESEEALPGKSVMLTLTDEPQVNRGDVIVAATLPIEAADQFMASLLWLSAHDLIPGRLYTAKLHTQRTGATVTEIKYRIDMNSGAQLAAKSIAMNEIAVVNLSFERAVGFEPYARNRTLGAFILIDELTTETVAAGMISFALRRAANIHWQAIEVNPGARAALKGQRARCFWFSGLPASGKSTIANLLDKRLHADGLHTYMLDGDNVRHGLNRDLGFTEADRVENIRRVAEVARLMVDAGLIVLVSFISPFKAERAFARSLFRPGEFVEVYVDTSPEVCEKRDPKGLYARARCGLVKNFTGLDSPYEVPENPDVWIKTIDSSAAEAAERLAERARKDS